MISRTYYRYKIGDITLRHNVLTNYVHIFFQCWDDYWECYYYWNMETRKVSWLPPDDPDAEITDPEIRKG